MTQWVKNLTAVACVTMEVRVCSLAQWVKGSSSATAAAWIQSLAWELTYAVGTAIKKKKKKISLWALIKTVALGVPFVAHGFEPD